jgi:signal peptidase I
MAPAISDGDYVFVNKLAYRDQKPQRGDVVVSAISGNSYQHIIKRIIALPGERIKVEHNQVFLKKERTDEWVFLTENYIELPQTDKNKIIDVGITYINIDPKEYFAMGDNRMVSIDSRELGAISERDIKGKAFLKFNFRNGFKTVK